MDNKEVVVGQTRDLAEFTGDLGFTGFEGVENDAGSFAIPFLKIAQALSHEVDEEHEDYIEGLKKGDFFNSVTGENYGREASLIVVYSKRVYNEYKPNRGGFVASHDRVVGASLIRDIAEYPYVNKNTGNDLVETQTLFCIISGTDMIIFPMSSTSLKHAKVFLSRADMLKKEDGKTKVPLPSILYSFGTVSKSNDQGSWFQVTKNSISQQRGINGEEANAVRSAYKLFKDTDVDYGKAEDSNSDDATTTPEGDPF